MKALNLLAASGWLLGSHCAVAAIADRFDYPIGNRGAYTEVNDGDGWYVAQEFGDWNATYSGYHLGEDWNAESGGNTDCGSPVYSVANGTIVYANIASGWGRVLIVRHTLPDGSQVESLYGHLGSFAKTSGDVARGDPVGAIGDGSEGGKTYPCHLHLEVRKAACPNWGQPGPGYSATPKPVGWTDPSDFIDTHFAGVYSQQWQFITGANPANPDVTDNPYGTPTAVITPGFFSSGWVGNALGYGTHTRYWDLGASGNIVLTIPNSADPNQTLTTTLKIMQFYDGGIYTGVLSYSVAGAVQVGGTQTADVEVTGFGKWVEYTTVWNLNPSPGSESIRITGPARGAIFDQITVHNRLAAVVGATITSQPQSQTAPAGANVTLSVSATGTGQLFYQWRKNGVAMPGKTGATLALNSVSPSDSDGYSVVVWNAYGSAVSATAHLAVLADGASGTQPNQITAPTSPTKPAGVDSLLIVTHGWQWKLLYPEGLYPKGPPMPSWVTDLRNAIRANVGSNWEVETFDWTPEAWTWTPDSALNHAIDKGSQLGLQIAAQGWQQVHLIGHSAGAGLIQAVADAIRASGRSIVVHTTFLDPYLGFDYHGLSEYGRNADWADCYFAHDALTGSFTEGALLNAYNLDVTWVDGDRTTLPIACPSSTAGSTPPVLDQICGYQAWSSHDWPHEFYRATVLGAGLACTAGYNYGFPLSKEGGGWDSRGGRHAGDAPLVPCGLPSASQNPFPLITGQPLQISLLPYGTSAAGVGLLGRGFTMGSFLSQPGPRAGAGGSGHVAKDDPPISTNAPSWLAVALTVTNAVNFVTFEAGFTSTNAAQGLMTVYWNTNEIGMVDERAESPGLQTYRLALPGAVTDGLYTVSFRLDAFTNAVSSITVTNVATGFVGITEPLKLEMLLWASNSIPVLKLTGAPNYNYLVESSTNLVNWMPTALLVNTNGTVLFADPGRTNSSGRFYRAVMP